MPRGVDKAEIRVGGAARAGCVYRPLCDVLGRTLQPKLQVFKPNGWGVADCAVPNSGVDSMRVQTKHVIQCEEPDPKASACCAHTYNNRGVAVHARLS